MASRFRQSSPLTKIAVVLIAVFVIYTIVFATLALLATITHTGGYGPR
jgi:hypothetical protein